MSTASQILVRVILIIKNEFTLSLCNLKWAISICTSDDECAPAVKPASHPRVFWVPAMSQEDDSIKRGFWGTDHLPLPWVNNITYFSLWAKLWLRGGVGGQVPRNLNWSNHHYRNLCFKMSLSSNVYPARKLPFISSDERSEPRRTGKKTWQPRVEPN